MGVADRLTGRTAATLDEGVETVQRIRELADQVEAANDTVDMLTESMADLELAREDVGWRRIGSFNNRQISRDGLARSAELCRVMVTANPLIKRGLQLRHAYVWGGGVEIEARDSDNEDLSDLVGRHKDVNIDVLFGAEAQEERERDLGTDGNIFLAHFTKPLTGAVKVRALPFSEFVERITNPDDRDETWYYLRRWEAEEVSAAGVRSSVKYEAYYPDLAYRPRARPKMIDDVEVLWDAPIRHVHVNRLSGQDWGIGDAFASIDWARAYSDYLNDWARLMKALAKYAWRVTGETKGKAANAAAKIQANAAAGTDITLPAPNGAGQTVVSSGTTLEAIPKSGATLDSESGKPLAAMAATGLGVPVTMLLGDPGTTGARAVAETLDKPTTLTLRNRQRLWQRVYTDSIRYAMLSAIRAPRGPLTGRLGRDEWDAETFELTSGDDDTVEVTFGDIDDTDIKTQFDAIVAAEGLDLIPDDVILRAALVALPGVEDIDEIIARITNEDGTIQRPSVLATAAVARADREGRNPDGTQQ